MFPRSFLVLASCVATAFCFSAAPGGIGLRTGRLAASPRALRTSQKMSLNYYDLAAKATNILLAIDTEESNVDKLYNGIPATGAVNAPVWVLPVAAITIAAVLAIAVPLLLKPGTDAFNDQRNDIGVFSDKDKK